MFKETKLVFWAGSVEHRHGSSESSDVADMINRDAVKNTSEGRDIVEKQEDLRKKIDASNLLTDEDRQAWNRKLENAQNNLSASALLQLQQEFSQEQNAIKGMVDTYTRKVLNSKEEAFAVDRTRGVDTASDYLKWFETQSYSEKQAALNKLDADIDERKALRKKLLTKLDKKEVIKMRRSEMKDKLQELEIVEANSERYKSMLQKDANLFHDINLYLEAFEDLTPHEQEDWMRRYEQEIAKPRREMVETHDALPQRFKSPNFLKMPSRKKQEYLEATETKIEKEYTSQIGKIPSEIWSEESKRFAIDDFMKLDSIAKKAQWLEFLPNAIKAEEKLAKQFKQPKFTEVREMADYSTKKWERSRFEDKEQMLKGMEAEVTLLGTFKSIMDKSTKENVISDKTRDRYMDMYNDGNLSSRRTAVRSIMIALSPRRELLKDFEKLNPETQKQFSDFYDRGHKARLEIYKKAKTHEAENMLEEAKDKELNKPEALEENEVIQIVKKLQKQADASEQSGNLEKALGLHEAVLAMHPENELSKNKVDQLNMELNALETASDENVLEAVDNQLRTGSNQQELKYIKLAQQILEDKEDVVNRAHGNENLGKQVSHLGEDSFDRAVHEDLVKKSGGEKIIDYEGRAKKVRKIDLGRLGSAAGDTTQIEKELRNLPAQENLDNVQLVDKAAGKTSTIDEARRRLEDRKRSLAKKIADEETFSLDEHIAA